MPAWRRSIIICRQTDKIDDGNRRTPTLYQPAKATIILYIVTSLPHHFTSHPTSHPTTLPEPRDLTAVAYKHTRSSYRFRELRLPTIYHKVDRPSAVRNQYYRRSRCLIGKRLITPGFSHLDTETSNQLYSVPSTTQASNVLRPSVFITVSSTRPCYIVPITSLKSSFKHLPPAPVSSHH